MRKIHFSLILSLALIFGCLGGGTHGSIKGYQYPVSKYILQKAVLEIIRQNKNIYKDSIIGYYNNDSVYISIKIIYENIRNRYTFRFSGSKEYWDTSNLSSIYIAYAFNKEHKGGSAGDGGIMWYNFNLKKDLIEPFEKEMISNLNKKLNLKPIIIE